MKSPSPIHLAEKDEFPASDRLKSRTFTMIKWRARTVSDRDGRANRFSTPDDLSNRTSTPDPPNQTTPRSPHTYQLTAEAKATYFGSIHPRSHSAKNDGRSLQSTQTTAEAASIIRRDSPSIGRQQSSRRSSAAAAAGIPRQR